MRKFPQKSAEDLLQDVVEIVGGNTIRGKPAANERIVEGHESLPGGRIWAKAEPFQQADGGFGHKKSVVKRVKRHRTKHTTFSFGKPDRAVKRQK